MAFYRGAGGVVWEIDPPEGPKRQNQREVFAEAIRKGELVECQADGSDLDAPAPKKAAPAKKAAAPKADPEPEV